MHVLVHDLGMVKLYMCIRQIITTLCGYLDREEDYFPGAIFLRASVTDLINVK